MSRLLLTLFVVLAIFSAATLSVDVLPPRCPKNEVWVQCKRECEPVCKMAPRKDCAVVCISGCACQKGLVRNNKGQCVNPALCKV